MLTQKALHAKNNIDIQYVSRKIPRKGLISIVDNEGASIQGLYEYIKKVKK